MRQRLRGGEAVAELRRDLVFLDMQMPKLDGFEVLELLGARGAPAVVFVTAYDEHAMRAFEVHAVDYLLKPVSPERLAEALERVAQRLGAPPTPPLPAAALAAAARPAGRPLERVLMREGGQVHVMPVESIDYVEAQDDYVASAPGTSAPQAADPGRARRRSSIPTASCASTARSC